MTSTTLYKVNGTSRLSIVDRVQSADIEELARELAKRRMYLECVTDYTPRLHCYLGKNECQYQGREIMINCQTLYQCKKPSIN